jgi:hypothetical protein
MNLIEPFTVSLLCRGVTVLGRRQKRLLENVLSGRSDANIPFEDLISSLQQLGFSERMKGDHHILWKRNVAEIINLQPKGSKAKPYQVRQVRRILLKYRLGSDDE